MARAMHYSMDSLGLQPAMRVSQIYTAQDATNFLKQAVAFDQGERLTMTGHLMRLAGSLALSSVICLALPCAAGAQTIQSCSELASNVHQALDCIEGILSEAPVHLTLSSVPPGNGFPIGIVYEDAVHHIGGYKSLTDTRLALVGSSNGSWYAIGSFTWLPPLHYTDMVNNGVACHQLGPFCTKQVMGLELYATHRSLKTLSFYGLGSSTPDTHYLFKETDTYGGSL